MRKGMLCAPLSTANSVLSVLSVLRISAWVRTSLLIIDLPSRDWGRRHQARHVLDATVVLAKSHFKGRHSGRRAAVFQSGDLMILITEYRTRYALLRR